MKKIYTLLSATLFSVMAFAQNSSLTFFSDKGEKFWVLLNGVAQNAKPETNVKINGLTPNFYRVKVVFQIDTLGEINSNINVDANMNDVYIVKKRTTPKVLKKTKITNDINIDKYVLRPFSTSENGGQPAPTSNQDVIVYGQGEPLNTEEVVHPINTSVQIQTSQTTTTTTTTKQKNAPANTTSPGSVNFNMNVDPNSGSMNINMNGNGVNVQTNQQNQSTTSTTTTTTTTTRNQAKTPAPAPARTTTVIRAMSNMDFDKAVAQIKAQSFEDSKMKVAKQVLKNNYMNCNQIKTIMKLFSYEESKLDFAKTAYERCVEKNNYYLLNDAFTFSTSVDELNEFLESK